MKILLYSGLFLLILFPELSAQHFIGLNKEEASLEARKNGFYRDDMTVAQKFNYLKFVNSANTKTLIIFFSDEDLAMHTRTVCDYSEYDFLLKDFGNNYKKVSQNTWEYQRENEKFEVTIEEKEWYFVVRTKKK
jgi:hypothetical protein